MRDFNYKIERIVLPQARHSLVLLLDCHISPQLECRHLLMLQTRMKINTKNTHALQPKDLAQLILQLCARLLRNCRCFSRIAGVNRMLSNCKLILIGCIAEGL